MPPREGKARGTVGVSERALCRAHACGCGVMRTRGGVARFSRRASASASAGTTPLRSPPPATLEVVARKPSEARVLAGCMHGMSALRAGPAV